MSTISIGQVPLAQLLEELLGRDVTMQPVEQVDAHPATYRGMVTDSDDLVAVIGSDLEFAHAAGAALALIPAGRLDGLDQPDDVLLEIYTEVANVMSRLVNEATIYRTRLDPGIVHSPEALQATMSDGSLIEACAVTIGGYGSGNLGIWYNPPPDAFHE